jgi:CRP-like cAMP-binding protein
LIACGKEENLQGALLMYLKISDFFSGMGKEFTLDAMEIAQKVNYNKGDILFHSGDPAGHFYVLVKGSVRLGLGQTGPQIYLAKQPGEIIGWSCLIGLDSYSASAECVESTNLVKFDRDGFLSILKKYPAKEALLYRRVAETLGNRLLELYPNIS